MIWLSALLVLLILAALMWLVYQKARTAGRLQERQLWIGIARDIGHQFATPLSALMGWVDLMPTQKNLDAVLLEMNRDLDRLKLISNRLSQVGAPLQFEILELRQIITEVRTYFQKRLPAGDRGIEIGEESEGKPKVRANRELLQWALEHLVRNSVDAFESGSGRIILRVQEAGPEAILEVEDNGRGIGPKLRRKIFKPGFTTKVGGRGSGLALVKLIIEDDHAGRFTLQQTRPGQGTTFRITLPSAGEV